MPKHQAVAVEANFDGLPGPTHNYSGLATGNLASERKESNRGSALRDQESSTDLSWYAFSKNSNAFCFSPRPA